MKAKKIGQKLALSKTTVSNLNVDYMRAIQAGEEPTSILTDNDLGCYTLWASCFSLCQTNCLTCFPPC